MQSLLNHDELPVVAGFGANYVICDKEKKRVEKRWVIANAIDVISAAMIPVTLPH